MASPSTYVVIVNYRSATLLSACITSLLVADVHSITVVDNNSGLTETPSLREIERRDPRIRVVFGKENLGFGAGANLGVHVADPSPNDNVWILNPDTTIAKDSALELSFALSQRIADVVSPLILTGMRTRESVWFAGGYVDYRRGVSWHVGAKTTTLPLRSEPYSSSFITGAAPMMSKSTWDSLGGFRDDLFLYWEDVDMSARAKDLDLRLALVPNARIWHAQGGSTGQSNGGHSQGYYYYGQRNRLIVCGTRSNKLQLILGTGVRETFRLLVEPLLLDTSPHLSKLTASIRGIVDGIRGVTGRGPY